MTRTVQQALAQGVRALRQAGIDSAPRDARLLMAACLGIAPGRMTLHLPDTLDADAEAAFFTRTARRATRVPLSHILGQRAFHGRDFAVTAAVLDPRPETETLVEQALAAPFSTVLDLGTGSGAIIVTLLAERPLATGTGTDLSQAALDVAARNAAAHGVERRCRLIRSDWFAALGGRFDLIVSNPPYIAAGEMAGLAPELAHEPRMALTDEADGLSAYRAITARAPAHLALGGRLIVEIGPTQAAPVGALFTAAGLSGVGVARDLDGRARVVFGHLAG